MARLQLYYPTSIDIKSDRRLLTANGNNVSPRCKKSWSERDGLSKLVRLSSQITTRLLLELSQCCAQSDPRFRTGSSRTWYRRVIWLCQASIVPQTLPFLLAGSIHQRQVRDDSQRRRNVKQLVSIVALLRCPRTQKVQAGSNPPNNCKTARTPIHKLSLRLQSCSPAMANKAAAAIISTAVTCRRRINSAGVRMIGRVFRPAARSPSMSWKSLDVDCQEQP